MIGQRVGNYRITKLLGQGGMGVVYLAEHPGIGRKAAVKVLHAELAKNQEIVGRFFNEARAANAIHHPGIVDVLDFGTLTSGAPYIVMEFLDGESLAARIKRKVRLPVGDAVEIAFQSAGALGAAHANGIVHRDLKPDNLFLVSDLRTPGREVVKVLDFGIAKLGLGLMGGGPVKTQTGVVMGTPVYMSPEQCRGTKEVDHRTDVYALGIILYEMLCGDPPFASEGHGELLFLHISAAPPRPRTRNAAIPLEIENLILRTLAKDPASRVQTMGEFQQLLGASTDRTIGVTSSDLTAPTPGLPPSGEPALPRTTLSSGATTVERKLTKRRRWLWGVPIALGVVTIAAAVLFAVTSMPRGRPLATFLSAPSSKADAPRTLPEVVSIGGSSESSGARLAPLEDGAAVDNTPRLWARERADGGVEFTTNPPPAGTRWKVWLKNDPEKASTLRGHTNAVAPRDVRPMSLEEKIAKLVDAGFSDEQIKQILGEAHPRKADSPSPLQEAQAKEQHRGGRSRTADSTVTLVNPAKQSNDQLLASLSDEELLALLETFKAKSRTKAPSPGRPNRSPASSEAFDPDEFLAKKASDLSNGAHVSGQDQKSRSEACSITIGSRPWSDLWIDGKSTGRTTPYAENIACGKHELAFKRPDLNLVRTEHIALREGEQFKESYSLEPNLEYGTAAPNTARATAAQVDISRVINDHRQGIQTCYQRALLRDNTLTRGQLTVRVSISSSGKVKSVNLDAPPQFRALEPCIREVMSRWAFPPSSEDYGTSFPVVLQGNQ